MDHKTDEQSPPTTAAICEQRIVGQAGSEEVRRTVWCTIRSQTVPLSLCQGCPRRDRIVIDPSGRHSELVCAMPPAEPAGNGGDALRLRAPISELMAKQVICVRAELSMRAVLMVLVEHGINGAPVVDAAGRPVGMISVTDLLREQYDQIEDEEDELLPHWAREAIERHRTGARPSSPHALTAEDIMTPSVFSLREDARAGDAAVEMARRSVHRLLVVSREGALVGMVTALDVMRWLAAGIRASAEGEGKR